DVVEVVTAELVEEVLGQDDGYHRLTDDAGGRDLAGVGALVVRLRRLFGGVVDRRQGVDDGRDGLDGDAYDQGLAVGHAAFGAAGAVGQPAPAVGGVVADLILGLRAKEASNAEAFADFDTLDGRDAHNGAGDLPVETA